MNRTKNSNIYFVILSWFDLARLIDENAEYFALRNLFTYFMTLIYLLLKLKAALKLKQFNKLS